MRILKTKSIHRAALVGVACALSAVGTDLSAQPLVTGDLTIYYNFDSFTDIVMDGSGNGFNGKVRDSTRNMTDSGEIGQLTTSGVISNDTSNPKRGAGAIRFAQSSVPGDDPVYVDMDGGVIKATAPSKVPKEATTAAAWVNLPEVNTTIGGDGNWNSPGSILQGSTSFPGHAVPHFHAEGNGSFRLALRNESSQNIVSSNGAPWTAHPFPNQPEIDTMGAAPEPWPLNEWFHVAYTYDKNANGGAGEFAMYYNGEKIRGGPPNGVGPVDLGAWDIRSFGQYFDGLGIGAVYDSGGRRLHGLMDELYIFTRALSAEEIGTLAMLAPPVTPGDYNEDGTVDAVDYVVWRKNPAAFGGDPDGYNTWRTNFGRMSGGGSALVSGAAIPEPTSWVLAVLVAIGIVLLKRLR